ncbi:MAG: S49 family peptidase [Deltaproteobacteria bacterium]|nr:S49 family peptidase [Deltaproteobacteria bacterium]
MILSRLAALVINTPLMILPDKLNTILSVIGHRIGVDAKDVDIILQEIEPPPAIRTEQEIPEEISVIPVLGSLAFRSVGLSPQSGLTTYDDIRNDFKAALESDSKAILFNIDSPGGEAAGLMDLADEIYNARGEKPIYAVANESAYSAAYAIASAADEVFLSRSAGIGSVGVIAIHMDQVEFDKKVGVKYTSIFAGARKNDRNPHEPLSSEAKQILEKEVSEHYELFTQTVARNRGIKVAQVKATEAGLFMGEKGVKVGFADGVQSFGATIDYILGNRPKEVVDVPVQLISREVKKMTYEELKQKHPELLAEIKESINNELTAKFQAEKQELENKLAQERDGFLKERKDLEAKVAALEKSEAIRREKELKLEAENVWLSKLNESDIPERLFEKVMTQVSHDRFMKDGVLDLAGFEAAVDAEIQDWENRGATSEALGFGVTLKEVDNSAVVKEEKEDEALADSLFELSGGERKEVE